MARRSGLRIEGVSELITRFDNVSKVSNAKTSKALKQSATEVQKLARKFAPLDRGNLEDAIQVIGGNKVSRAYAQYFVGVNESHPVPERPGHTVGDYALEMHEGEYDLGERSQEKARNLGVEVGPKYLERALEELEKPIIENFQAVVKETISGK